MPAMSLAAVLAVLTVGGCTRGGQAPVDGPLPDAAQLLEASAQEMAGVQTARLSIEADAEVADLAVRRVDGVVTRSGEAEGTAQVEQFGVLAEADFVVVAGTFHFRLVGGWQQVPLDSADALYDPSAILDPDRGVAALLRTATDAQTGGQDSLDGVDTYQVTAAFDAAVLDPLLPGIGDGVTGTLWLGSDRPVLHQARFEVPDGAGTVTVTLSDFDAPVDISAP